MPKGLRQRSPFPCLSFEIGRKTFPLPAPFPFTACGAQMPRSAFIETDPLSPAFSLRSLAVKVSRFRKETRVIQHDSFKKTNQCARNVLAVEGRWWAAYEVAHREGVAASKSAEDSNDNATALIDSGMTPDYDRYLGRPPNVTR